METLDSLLPANSGQRQTLADIIFAKLNSAESESQGAAVIQKMKQSMSNHRVFEIVPNAPPDPSHMDPALGLNPRVVEAYTKCGLHPSHSIK